MNSAELSGAQVDAVGVESVQTGGGHVDAFLGSRSTRVLVVDIASIILEVKKMNKEKRLLLADSG